MKEVNTQNLWSFDLGTQEGINVLIWIIVAFQQSDPQRDQTIKSDIFYRPPVISAHCIIGTEKNPDSAISLNYSDDDYSQGHAQIKEAFTALSEDDILRPYISKNDFRSTNDGKNIGSNLYVFDIRYQEKIESAQPIKVDFNFGGVVPAGVYMVTL